MQYVVNVSPFPKDVDEILSILICGAIPQIKGGFCDMRPLFKKIRERDQVDLTTPNDVSRRKIRRVQIAAAPVENEPPKHLGI